MEANLNMVREYYPKGSYVLGICSTANNDFAGTIFFPAGSRTVVFNSVWELLKQIDTDIQKNAYPQSTFELRKWSKKEDMKKSAVKAAQAEPQKQLTPYCTFLIQIQFCQNATWQGSIHWMEGRQQKSFRSQFEMLRLMEEAAL
jgi:hypothetical protein